jgi:hypothetical protein
MKQPTVLLLVSLLPLLALVAVQMTLYPGPVRPADAAIAAADDWLRPAVAAAPQPGASPPTAGTE